MAFNNNNPKVSYEAVDGQTVFPFIFKIFFLKDILVYHTPVSTGLTVLMILGVDYNVVVNGDDGGVVTLVNPTSAGDFVVLQRSLDIDRFVEYQTSGDLLANTLNADQDYQTYLLADLQVELDSAITAPPGTPDFDGTLPSPIPEAYLRWATDGKSLENDIAPPTWRDETLQYRNEAEAFKDAAAISASDAFASKELAALWSESPVEVEPGHYSSKYWANLNAANLPMPDFPADEGLALVARQAGNDWEKILGLPLETNNQHKTVTTKGVEGDSFWSPFVTSPNVVSEDFTLATGASASIVSPTINDGITVEVPDGSTLVIL